MIKKFLDILGFIPKNDCNGIYFKKYNNIGKELNINLVENSSGEIDRANSKINYKDLEVTVTRKTTSNLSQDESLAVLECIDRLFKKGLSARKYSIGKRLGFET